MVTVRPPRESWAALRAHSRPPSPPTQPSAGASKIGQHVSGSWTRVASVRDGHTGPLDPFQQARWPRAYRAPQTDSRLQRHTRLSGGTSSCTPVTCPESNLASRDTTGWPCRVQPRAAPRPRAPGSHTPRPQAPLHLSQCPAATLAAPECASRPHRPPPQEHSTHTPPAQVPTPLPQLMARSKHSHSGPGIWRPPRPEAVPCC